MKQPKFPANELDCLFLLGVLLMAHRNNPAHLRKTAKNLVKIVPKSTRPAFALISLSKIRLRSFNQQSTTFEVPELCN